MPYERREYLVPRATNYHRVYSRKNWRKRWELRGIYESVLLGRNSYNGSVITSSPTNVDSPGHRFYLNNTFIVSVKVEYPFFTPTLHFARTDYNKFRLFLRNIGIRATGRKHITTIHLPTGKSLKFDHLKGLSYSYPPIRFLLREENATELLHARLDGPVSRTGEQLQQNTFNIPWNSQRVIYAARREAEHQVLYSTLTQVYTRVNQREESFQDALRYTFTSSIREDGLARRLFGGLDQGTASNTITRTFLRPPDVTNVTQRIYPSILPLTDQQIWD